MTAIVQVDNVINQAAEKAQKSEGASLQTFLASISTAGLIFVFASLIHAILTRRFPSLCDRAGQTSTRRWKPFSWSLSIIFSSIPDPDFSHVSGFENYLLDRYLFTVARMFLLLTVIIPPILIPLNAIDGKNVEGGVQGLDQLTFANVGFCHTNRYWFHFGLAICAVAWISFVLQNEIRQYAKYQERLASCEWNSSILLRSSSWEDLTPERIHKHFHKIGGGVYLVKRNYDYRSLRAKVRQRDALVQRLEIAATNLVKTVNIKVKRAQNDAFGPSGCSEPSGRRFIQPGDRPKLRKPFHNWLPTLPFVGPQVDSIQYYSEEVTRYNTEILRHQSQPDSFPTTNSAFVYFNRGLPASPAALALRARIPPSWTVQRGTTPQNIIWRNISLGWWQQATRSLIVYSLIAILILCFGFPVTLVGTLSQIGSLASRIEFLSWIHTIPPWLLALVQGVLPPALLALLMSTVPAMLRLLANMQGQYSLQAVENNVQIYYFTFLFIQVFLVVSLSAGLTTIVGETGTIKAVPTILARNLPKASNYFLSYVTIYTFTTIASSLLQLKRLVHLLILSPMLDTTARQKWTRLEGLALQEWGTFIPALTNIACIGVIYAVTAPLILPLSLICYGALWALYRLDPPTLSEVGCGMTGAFFPTAIRQLFTGIYFMELSIAGLFFLVRDSNGEPACRIQGVLMIVAVSFTGVFQYMFLGDHSPKWARWKSLQRIYTKTRSRKVDEQSLGRCRAQKKILPSRDDVLSAAQPIIWIPRDELGLVGDEIYNLDSAFRSLQISTENAILDRNGSVRVSGPPPDSWQWSSRRNST